MDIQQKFAPLTTQNVQSIEPFSPAEKIEKFLTMKQNHLERLDASETLLKINDSNNANDAKALLTLKNS
tara:strand:+ start:669 stop:875 length:207 start_codon:yes stop_codon:yes gene_type:complete